MFILDNGHGVDTAGKRSPIWADGKQLMEYEFNRDITQRIAYRCKMNGIPFTLLVPEAHDISLTERVSRANDIYMKHPRAVVVSIHANAGGGTGYEVWTSKGKTRSDAYADILMEEAERELGGEFRMRKDYADGDTDKESQFTILANTLCPAMLSECLFMDTERDCRFLMSEEGRERITNFHFKAIQRIWREFPR